MLVTFFVVGCLTGIGPYDLPVQSRRLEDVMAESRALGLPMTQKELVGDPPPVEDNAAPIVIPIIRELKREYNKLIKDHGGDPFPPQVVLDDFIRENESKFAAVQAAVVQRKSWWVDRDYDQGPYLMFSEYGDLRRYSEMALRRSVLLAKKGEPHSALEGIWACRLLARALFEEPVMLGFNVACGMEGVLMLTVEALVAEWSDNARLLAMLESILSEFDYKVDLIGTIRREFYFALVTCRNFKQFGGFELLLHTEHSEPIEPDMSNIRRTGLPDRMFERASMTVMAEHYNQMIRDKAEENVESLNWINKADERLAQMTQDQTVSSQLALKMLYNMWSEMRAINSARAKKRIGVAFVRAMRYRVEQGRWPESLGAIGSELPDPFKHGSSIQMRATGSELRVWSVGVDGRDDRGLFGYVPNTTPDPYDADYSDDIVIVWPPNLRPEKN